MRRMGQEAPRPPRIHGAGRRLCAVAWLPWRTVLCRRGPACLRARVAAHSRPVLNLSSACAFLWLFSLSLAPLKPTAVPSASHSSRETALKGYVDGCTVQGRARTILCLFRGGLASSAVCSMSSNSPASYTDLLRRRSIVYLAGPVDTKYPRVRLAGPYSRFSLGSRAGLPRKKWGQL